MTNRDIRSREEEAIECAERFEKAGCVKGGLLIGMYRLIFEGATNEHKTKCEVGHQRNKGIDFSEQLPFSQKLLETTKFS